MIVQVFFSKFLNKSNIMSERRSSGLKKSQTVSKLELLGASPLEISDPISPLPRPAVFSATSLFPQKRVVD
jgi:hypothetical protein